MPEERFTNREIQLMLEPISDALTRIETNTLEVSTRVNKVEEAHIEMMNSIREMAKRISDNNGNYMWLKNRMDENDRKYVANLENQVAVENKDRQLRNTKIISAIVIGMLVIAGYVGLINKEVINSLIGLI